MDYPRSFLKFILLGFLLVSLPLLYALAELTLSFDRLVSQSRDEVLQTSQAARASRQLFEQTTTLERIVRQYLILEDHALVDDYNRLRQDFRATVRQLAQLPLERGYHEALQGLGKRESDLHARLTSGPKTGGGSVELAEGYGRLVDDAQTMLAASNALTQTRSSGCSRLPPRAATSGAGWQWRPAASRSRWRSCSPC